MDEKFYTTEQVANILQVHPFTILKFIKQGKLKGLKLGRVYRIKESDVNQFIEERMTQPSKKKQEITKEAVKDKKVYTVEKMQEKKPSNNPDPNDHYYII